MREQILKSCCRPYCLQISCHLWTTPYYYHAMEWSLFHSNKSITFPLLYELSKLKTFRMFTPHTYIDGSGIPALSGVRCKLSDSAAKYVRKTRTRAIGILTSFTSINKVACLVVSFFFFVYPLKTFNFCKTGLVSRFGCLCIKASLSSKQSAKRDTSILPLECLRTLPSIPYSPGQYGQHESKYEKVASKTAIR